MKTPQIERRLRMLRALWQGLPPKKLVVYVHEQLEKEGFQVSESTIWNDWRDREEWMPFFAKIGDADIDQHTTDTILQLDEVIRLAFNTYLSADNSSAKVGALKLVVSVATQKMAFLQSLGKVDKVADRIQADVTSNSPIILFDPSTAILMKRKEEEEEPEEE